jgi:hypothetical protein
LDLAETIVVLTVTAIADPDATTNGQTASVSIRVDACVKGEQLEGTHQVIWAPSPHDVDWHGAGSAEALAKWSAQSNPLPEIGSRWISRLQTYGETRVIPPKCRYEFSAERLAWVKETLRIFSLSKANMELRRRADEIDLRSADSRLAATANIKTLVEGSQLVVVGMISSENNRRNDTIFTLTVSARLKGEAGALPKQILILVPRDEAPILILRSTDLDGQRREVVAFVRPAPFDRPSDSPRTANGEEEPVYELVDQVNGIMKKTTMLVESIQGLSPTPGQR